MHYSLRIIALYHCTQVCTRWRDILYARPRLWTGLVPVVRCREARAMQPTSRTRLYASLVRRGFDSLVLLAATDEDIPELTRGFPLAQRYVHSLSLRCCAVTDRGLETLLDHLQVNIRFLFSHAVYCIGSG